jgi:hypothetical protein
LKFGEFMTATLVPTVRTPCTQYDLVKAFIGAWQEMYGSLPTKQQIGVVWAQNALETGLTHDMWNYNLGNIKYVANPGDDESLKYCMLENVWEIVNGQRVVFQPPNPATWFRAFDTLTEGVFFYFNFLRNKRYRTAWTAVEAGDPAGFSHLLKMAGYYTAPEADYTRAEMAYFNKFMGSDYFDRAMAELNGATVQPPSVVDPVSDPNDPIVPPPIDFTPPEPPVDNNSEGPLQVPGIWQKIKNIFGR